MNSVSKFKERPKEKRLLSYLRDDLEIEVELLDDDFGCWIGEFDITDAIHQQTSDVERWEMIEELIQDKRERMADYYYDRIRDEEMFKND